MLVKRFKNGNYNVKLDGHECGYESTLVNLIWALDDCSLFGEEYCLGNALGMAVDLYDYWSGKVITIPYAKLNILEEGKTLKLYAHNMNEYEKELYEELRELGEL